MTLLQRIWQKLSPNFLLVFVRFLLEPPDYKIRRKAVLRHFKKKDKNTLPSEIREALKYLRFHKYSPYPYYWTKKYDNLLPEVFRDEANKCNFILFDGKRMYFPKSYNATKVIWSARTIFKEQDPSSPHLYLTGDFQVENGSVIIDAGVAEGNFSLSVVEKARKLFLIECDKDWMEALRLTFAPWNDKVVFVEKYMSDMNSETTTCADELLKGEDAENYFIKLDIEGYEQKALSGMKGLLGSGKPVKINVCTYHHPGDLSEIEAILNSYGFKCHISDGYVLFFREGEEPSFRKALIRAEKK